jgi:hypothetical protein
LGREIAAKFAAVHFEMQGAPNHIDSNLTIRITRDAVTLNSVHTVVKTSSSAVKEKLSDLFE